MKRSNSPIFWALFGAGGMLSALTGTMLVFMTGFGGPLGFGVPADFLSYPRMLGLAQNFIGKAFIFAVIMLFAWHAAHRLLCTVHDFGIHKTVAVKTMFYGFAGILTVVSAWALLGLGF